MSQITRCPSCATKFRVVADQLRISDGWVRCGHCKGVFDASTHLVSSEPQALLPDLPMTDSGAAHTSVTPTTETQRQWGASPSALNLAAASVMNMPSAGARAPSWPAPAPDAIPDVPFASVPAFLVTGSAVASPSETEPVAPAASPFAWPPEATAAGTPIAGGAVPVSAPWAPAGDLTTHASSNCAGASRQEDDPVAWVDESRNGYELPSADLPDSQWPEYLPAEDLAPAATGLHPPLDLLRRPSVEGATLDGAGDEQAGASAQEHGAEQGSCAALHEPNSPEWMPGGATRRREKLVAAPVGGMAADQDEEGAPGEAGATDEVSFMRAAKRRAFWRRPLVRAGLGVVIVALLCTLALQAALHERDRIATLYPGMRPGLESLCGSFQCALAPLRQISDIVIDSSSFNKGRGDSYQLTFAIKNRASVPLAMPAMDLTLTDVQDQPVLRRVLLPQEIGAPAELPALGEWTSSVAVIVTTGGARVAGYRLLAFYP